VPLIYLQWLSSEYPISNHHQTVITISINTNGQGNEVRMTTLVVDATYMVDFIIHKIGGMNEYPERRRSDGAVAHDEHMFTIKQGHGVVISPTRRISPDK
jgi:ribosomal protein S17